MIEVKKFTGTQKYLEEIRVQSFNAEKKGHPMVTFPKQDTCPLLFEFFSERAKEVGKNLVFIHANKFGFGDSAPWHNDLEDGTTHLGMLYLTSDNFDLSEGGVLHLGLKSGLEVIEVASLTPNAGNFILIDNTLPDLVHKVTPLLSHKERFSVVGFFGTRESLL